MNVLQNSEINLNLIAHPNQTVFVLFHSLQCAMCAPMSHSLLLVADLLAELRASVDFVRIDSDRNDLPWHYTVDRLPALIVFPPDASAAESRIYPLGLAATVPNVLAFVLANVERPLRLHGMVLVCNGVRVSAVVFRRACLVPKCLTICFHSIVFRVDQTWPSRRLCAHYSHRDSRRYCVQSAPVATVAVFAQRHCATAANVAAAAVANAAQRCVWQWIGSAGSGADGAKSLAGNVAADVIVMWNVVYGTRWRCV